MVFSSIQICNSQRGLYLVNELATMEEVLIGFAWQQMKGYSSFVFSEDIQQFDSMLLRRLSVNFLIHLKDRLVSQARPFQFPRSTTYISDKYCGAERSGL